ncbi:MAG: energy transducer TonB, partial [Acidobacteriia bacterium]|nr:energy transducer TonB [Terriglobia bacterium]
MRAALRPARLADDADLGIWRDVFVRQRMPWHRFLQSAVLHAGALAMVWMLSIAWLRQNVIARPTFDPASLLTYSPEEYLPALDTGAPESAQAQKGDPEYSKQPIISVPREADNRTQTIVAPPDIRLDHDVPLPNIVAAGHVLPAVPLEATGITMARMVVPETAVVAPAPELDAARSRTARNTLTSEVIAPPPEVALNQPRGIAGPDAAVVEPPPELPNSSKGRTGPINIAASQVIAPAPQLAIAEQHTLAVRMRGGLPNGGAEPVAPPPTMSGVSGTSAGGRLIALGIHPVSPSGPVLAPGGNRRGTFAATPEGKRGASGTPDQTGPASTAAKGSGKGGNGNGGATSRGNSSLPSGLHVGAPDHSPVGSIAGSGGNGGSKNSSSEIRELASATPLRVGTNSHSAAPVSADKVTEVDRQVFGAKRFYSMTMNMPNLNSSTGSWVIRFAELKAGQQPGDLIRPEPTEKSDPGYPLELRRQNVQGTVTLYAVIQSDGSVEDVRVLNSPDERLDELHLKVDAKDLYERQSQKLKLLLDISQEL